MLPFLFLLTQTQSRTALLGLAVAVVLFVVMRGSDWRFLFVGPAVVAILYTSGFQWRSHGSMDRLMNLTGREYTWEKGVTLIEKSPFLGWGFHADRIMLNPSICTTPISTPRSRPGSWAACFFSPRWRRSGGSSSGSGLLATGRQRCDRSTAHSSVRIDHDHRFLTSRELLRVDGRLLRRRSSSLHPGDRPISRSPPPEPDRGILPTRTGMGRPHEDRHPYHVLPARVRQRSDPDERAGRVPGPPRGHEVEIVTTLPRPPAQRGLRGPDVRQGSAGTGFVVKRYPTNFTAHHIGRLIAWSIYTLFTMWQSRRRSNGATSSSSACRRSSSE